jgi:hypothetical protein
MVSQILFLSKFWARAVLERLVIYVEDFVIIMIIILARILLSGKGLQQGLAFCPVLFNMYLLECE